VACISAGRDGHPLPGRRREAGYRIPRQASQDCRSSCILEIVCDNRPGLAPVRILTARLQGTVLRHVRWKTGLTGEETAAAAGDLQAIVAGRSDAAELLAQVAGILVGASLLDGPYEQARAVLAAQVLVAAGADEWHIDYWTDVGRDRVAQARELPFGARLLGHPPGGSARG